MMIMTKQQTHQNFNVKYEWQCIDLHQITLESRSNGEGLSKPLGEI